MRQMRMGTFALFLLVLSVSPTSSQTPYRAPRVPGTTRPDLNGIWQALNTANWDLQAHGAVSKGVTPG